MNMKNLFIDFVKINRKEIIILGILIIKKSKHSDNFFRLFVLIYFGFSCQGKRDFLLDFIRQMRNDSN
jgi:hypothetical protein